MSLDHRESSPLSRRELLGGGALAGAAAALGWAGAPAAARGASPETVPTAPTAEASRDDDLGVLPKKRLGKTGVDVTILGLGTACMGEGPQDAAECAKVFAEAIDRGITYVDTARIYGDAETALGEVLATRRDKVFLVTKCMTDSAEEAQNSFETSLREMKVDHVDLLHLHSTGDRDIDRVLGPGGAWEYLRKMKAAGKTRFIGITGHNRPAKFLRMLDTKEVDVMMVAMNFVDRHTYGFEEKVLPRARELGVGVLGMKTFGGIRGGFRYTKQRRPSQMDPIYLQNAVRYSLSLEGVTGIVVGVHDAEELQQNIRYVLNAVQLSEKERESLREHGATIATEWGARFGPVEIE
jgi:predicted aldo/keto reductase-like oxidoreductase